MAKTPMFRKRPELRFTSGSRIKSTREMKRASVSDLSGKSGISAERILQAESDQIQLTLDEFERIAEALDPHPSTFAFPNWDHFEYRSSTQVLDGEFYLNGILDSTSISGSISYLSQLCVKIDAVKSLTIEPFHKFMARGEYSRKKHYSFRGDRLGYLHCTFSRGPEFDGDSRTVKEVDIEISYSCDGIHFEIGGMAATEGRDYSKRPASYPSGDSRFRLCFLVLPEQIRDFTGIYQEPSEQIVAALAKLPPRGN
jgi:transcriptional regulator with XRE-family HTH domain